MTGAAFRAATVDYALRYVGVREEPEGSNLGPQSGPHAHVIEKWQRWANGVTGYPWCSAFVCGMFHELWNLYIPEPRAASVGYFERWARTVGDIVTRPLKGDVVTYRWGSDDWPDHVGFVLRVIGLRWTKGRFIGTIKTVEGNTSAGNDANGGQVQIRYRSGLNCKFMRIEREELRKVSK